MSFEFTVRTEEERTQAKRKLAERILAYHRETERAIDALLLRDDPRPGRYRVTS